MKKLLNILFACGLISAASFSLLSCGKETMKVAILDSRDAAQTIKAMKPLEKAISKKLKEYNPKYNINVEFYPGGDYDAGATALQSGTTAFTFMSMEAYLKAREDKNKKISAAPLAIVGTNPFKADYNIYGDNLNNCLDPSKEDDDKRLKLLQEYDKILKNATNKENKFDFKDKNEFNDAALKKNAKQKAHYYRCFAYASNKLLEENNYKLNEIKDTNEYKEKTKKLIKDCYDKNNIFFKKSTSSLSGFIYPLKYISDMLDIKIDSKEFKGFVEKRKSYESEIEMINKLEDNRVITFSFCDIRRDLEKDNMNKALNNSTVIGTTEGIHEAGIHYSKVWMEKRKKDYDFVQCLRKAFKELIDSGQYKDQFGVYNHISYTIPSESEEAAKNWEKEIDEQYLDVRKNTLKPILDLLE